MGFLSGQYRFPTLWYLTMPVTPHFICIPAAVVIFIALVLSIMTSLSLPVIDALPIVQTTFNNGSLVISKTNATYNASNLQNVEEIKVRFLFFSRRLSLIFVSLPVWYLVRRPLPRYDKQNSDIYLQDFVLLLWWRSDMPSKQVEYATLFILIDLGLTVTKGGNNIVVLAIKTRWASNPHLTVDSLLNLWVSLFYTTYYLNQRPNHLVYIGTAFVFITFVCSASIQEIRVALGFWISLLTTILILITLGLNIATVVIVGSRMRSILGFQSFTPGIGVWYLHSPDKHGLPWTLLMVWFLRFLAEHCHFCPDDIVYPSPI